MNLPEDFKRWLDVLGANLNLEIGLDEENICTLMYGRDLCLSVAPSATSEAHFLIACPVLALTQDPAIDLHIYKRALQLSFMGEGLCTGTLGLANDSLLIAGLTFPYEKCDEVVFGNILINFAEECIRFREELSKGFEPDAGKKDLPLNPPGGVLDYV